ncbi:MAG: hypothetical protein WC822_06300 [Candidatus Paceibacterota bacterium]
MQKLERDDYGTIRFRENKIVRYLLDAGGLDLNKLAIVPFTKVDWAQFYQLIGYSVSGYCDLSIPMRYKREADRVESEFKQREASVGNSKQPDSGGEEPTA